MKQEIVILSRLVDLLNQVECGGQVRNVCRLSEQLERRGLFHCGSLCAALAPRETLEGAGDRDDVRILLQLQQSILLPRRHGGGIVG